MFDMRGINSLYLNGSVYVADTAGTAELRLQSFGLLAHAALFGGSYGGQAVAAMRRFV